MWNRRRQDRTRHALHDAERTARNRRLCFAEPAVHFRVVPSPGKTVYLLIKVGYTRGLFMETIDEAQAKPLTAAFQETDIDIKDRKAKMNYKDYYDRLFQ